MKNWTAQFSMIVALIMLSITHTSAQGFLHADGTKIVDGNNDNYLIRSIGTGNWMIMEGYMMQSSAAGIHTHTEFRTKLEETIGVEKTDSFYNVWLENHFTKRDLDSMKAWGFNSLRPALHYKWFTLPIEDEPVAGEQTWLNKGFDMLDSLVAWATENEMYIILDMHGAPGGQGKNKDISDYDESKPSLWESEYNKQKLVALWHKLAERYSNESYIGGYDMINETNWDFADSGNENGCNCTQNQPMHDIFKRIIDTIRLVDNNHMVFVSGNCWGNKYDGLNDLAELDDNLVFTFHKYWNFNDQASVDWILDRTNSLNVPVWMSEGGENSNTWFTNAIRLFEDNNIGWSWWPVKKSGINNIMEVTKNEDYSNLIKYWETGSPTMTEDEAFQAVLTWADNHKLENTFIHYDVIDAMTRQIYDYTTQPYKSHTVGEEIFISDYDFGRNNYAYFDQDTANHNSSTGTYTSWNEGWAYRNDGVDIEACTDEPDLNNGFNVGWTNKGEWLQYTLYNSQHAAYTIDIRSASGSGTGSKIHFEIDGTAISQTIQLPSTGDWQNWETTSVDEIIIPKGEIVLRLLIDEGGSNLNYFKIKDPVSVGSLDLKFKFAETLETENKISVLLSVSTTTVDLSQAASDFILFADDNEVAITEVESTNNPKQLLLSYNDKLTGNQKLELSYSGNSVMANDKSLVDFDKEPINNKLIVYFEIPGKIQAEDYYVNEGMSQEDCDDTGGGSNMGYANSGDYLQYNILVPETGSYKLSYRLATENANSKINMLVGNNDDFTVIDELAVEATGGWQIWKTQSSIVELTAGPQDLRMLVKSGEFNINWFLFEVTNSIDDKSNNSTFSIFPNPANDFVELNLTKINPNSTVAIYNVTGQKVYELNIESTQIKINTAQFKKGVYLVKIDNTTQRLIIN